jgi:ribosomal protein L7Ae-like RNA K-turn-binding protein
VREVLQQIEIDQEVLDIGNHYKVPYALLGTPIQLSKLITIENTKKNKTEIKNLNHLK